MNNTDIKIINFLKNYFIRNSEELLQPFRDTSPNVWTYLANEHIIPELFKSLSNSDESKLVFWLEHLKRALEDLNNEQHDPGLNLYGDPIYYLIEEINSILINYNLVANRISQ